MKSLTTMTDLAVTLSKDRPGELAKAVEAIAKAGINIEGYCEAEGIFHCVTNDPPKTRETLEKAGYAVRETPVAVFAADDRPGFLADVLSRVADQEINLTATYTLTNTRIAIGADEFDKLQQTLRETAPAAAGRS